MILHVLRKQEGPFLRAGRTEIEPLTGGWPEVFILAVRIGALDAGDALGIISASDKLIHDLGDPFDAETSIDESVLVFVLIGDALKIFLD